MRSLYIDKVAPRDAETDFSDVLPAQGEELCCMDSWDDVTEEYIIPELREPDREELWWEQLRALIA